MTGGEGVVGGLQQRKAGDAAGAALLLADHQPVGVETPARIQVKVQNLDESAEMRRKREGNKDVKRIKKTERPSENRLLEGRGVLGGPQKESSQF